MPKSSKQYCESTIVQDTRETFPPGISYKIVPCDDKRKRVRCNNGSLTIFSTERDPVPPINDLGGWLRNTSHKTVYHYRLGGGHQLQCILLYTTKKLVTHCLRWYTHTQVGVLSWVPTYGLVRPIDYALSLLHHSCENVLKQVGSIFNTTTD